MDNLHYYVEVGKYFGVSMLAWKRSNTITAIMLSDDTVFISICKFPY